MKELLKRLMTTLLATSYLFLFSQPAYAQLLLCIADKATGFQNNGNQWVPVPSLSVSDEKFMIRPPTDNEKRSYSPSFPYPSLVLKMIGSLKSEADGTCTTSDNRFWDIECGARGGRYHVNTKTASYIRLSWARYFENGVPFMEIGKCSPLN